MAHNLKSRFSISFVKVLVTDERRIANDNIELLVAPEHLLTVCEKICVDDRCIRDADAERSQALSGFLRLIDLEFHGGQLFRDMIRARPKRH